MTATTRLFITAGALGCTAGVITGAFGAHALGLILLGGLETAAPKKCHRVAGGLMMAGILLFSGSLFVLVLSGVRWLGMITPLGGVSFVAAWLVLAVCYLVADGGKAD